MPNWNTPTPDLTAWSALRAPYAGTTTSPDIVLRYPLPGAQNVDEKAIVVVGIRDTNLSLNTETIEIVINGADAYDATLFAAGFSGKVTYSAGTWVIQIVKTGGWAFDSDVTVTVYAEGFGGPPPTTTDTWTWSTRADPVCYSGTAPLDVEIAVQTPFTILLELEPVRQVFLGAALGTDPFAVASIDNKSNKAARVLYQDAFETELSAVLNPYNFKNEKALQTAVCERSNVSGLDAALAGQHAQIQVAIQSLFTLKVLPQAYVGAFLEYLDSTLPSYRVSLVANLLLLAVGYELASAPPAPAPLPPPLPPPPPPPL